MSQNKETNHASTVGAPKILSVNVAEEITMEDVGLGSGGKKDDPIARYNEEIMVYLKRYVAPHKKKSRWVEEKDIERVIEEGKILLTLCTIPRGMYGNISAIAHPQIDDQDPLRFFVVPGGLLVINPIIFNHTKVTVEKKEGCMSLVEMPMKEDVARYHKIEVMYQTLIQKEKPDGSIYPALSDVQKIDLSGPPAYVFQHEVAHLNAHYIYDEYYTADKAVGFGDGTIINSEELIKKYETQGQGKTSKEDDDTGGSNNEGAEVVRNVGVAEETGVDRAESGKAD